LDEEKMTKEFKKITRNTETRYILETTSAGVTGSSAVASAPSELKILKRRLEELKQKVSVPASKPRNPVGMGSTQGRGTQKHQATDRKKNKDDKKLHGEDSNSVNELKKSTIKSYADKKSAELWDTPEYPFRKPARSKDKLEKDAKGMTGALQRLSGQKPTSEESGGLDLGQKRELIAAFKHHWRGGSAEQAIRTTIFSLYAGHFLNSNHFEDAEEFLYHIADNMEPGTAPGDISWSGDNQHYPDHEEDRMGLGLSHDTSNGIAEDKDPCWNDYKQIGMKTKNGKKVPNCVPKK
jgi:hypothetical protein